MWCPVWEPGIRESDPNHPKTFVLFCVYVRSNGYWTVVKVTFVLHNRKPLYTDSFISSKTYITTYYSVKMQPEHYNSASRAFSAFVSVWSDPELIHVSSLALMCLLKWRHLSAHTRDLWEMFWEFDLLQPHNDGCSHGHDVFAHNSLWDEAGVSFGTF